MGCWCGAAIRISLFIHRSAYGRPAAGNLLFSSIKLLFLEHIQVLGHLGCWQKQLVNGC